MAPSPPADREGDVRNVGRQLEHLSLAAAPNEPVEGHTVDAGTEDGLPAQRRRGDATRGSRVLACPRPRRTVSSRCGLAARALRTLGRRSGR